MKEGRCSSQKGKQKVVEDIGTPNSKSKKGTSKKSQSPKTPKSPIATPNADAAQKGCSFRLWAGWMQSESSFQIKTLVPTHTCSRNFNLGSLVTYKWIAKQFAIEVLKNPKISYRQMVADVREKFMINVSVHQCRRAKQRAVYDLEGGLIDHYAKLWDYKDEILSTNPGSTVQLDVDTMDDGKTQFKRMYICYKAMKEGWRSCRRVIGLDGCFLKSPCRGSDFILAMGAYFTILSDGYKGLIEAAKELLPHAEHRLCARHIYANFKKKWNRLHYKSLFWSVAESTLEVHFKHKMGLIKNIDPLAYDWLMERDPKAWCRAYFQMDRSCATFENGISESYHSAIGIARTKPIISMLEEIRVYLMQRIVAMNQKDVNLNDIICPAIRKELEKLNKYQMYWHVVPCGQDLFEVRKEDEGFGVNLNTKTCTCKRWNLSGIPCIHAVAAYCMLNEDPGKGVLEQPEF
ncbi:hypothetical protein Tco_0774514 [Tanacetum coccineum]|uniref:SWIM-type domain-containing protein n=1 Tax=Tanacetum coccineum TaxID=301880 RepID=A0ABQ4ZSS1_9ASTR